MRINNVDYDVVAEDGNYILQGLHHTIILHDAFYLLEKEAESEARKYGAFYIDEDGDVQYDYDGSDITEYIENHHEQYIRLWLEQDKPKTIEDNNLN